MSDEELLILIVNLRKYCIDRRNREFVENDSGYFFVNVIDIACSLTELGIREKREIKAEEKYWFEGSYHMNFWNSDMESDYYSPLCREVERRSWFRKSFLKSLF
jgi:hypothetical protein